MVCICAMRAEECSELAEALGRPTYIGRKFVVCIVVGREGLRYRSRMESEGLNGDHTVWPIQSRRFEMKLLGQAEKPKFLEMRAPLSLPFYKKYLKMLKRPKKQPFSELSGKYLGI